MAKTYLVTKSFGTSMMHHVAMPVVGMSAAEELVEKARKKHTDFAGRVVVQRWLLVGEVVVPKQKGKRRQ